MTEVTESTAAAPGGTSIQWAWASAGFLLVLLAGAVVWLAITVADLRGEVRQEVEVVQASAAPVAVDPAATAPTAKARAKPPKPVPKSKGAPGYMPAIHPDDVKAKKMDTSKVIRKTAGELGLPGLPPDREVEVVWDGEDDPAEGMIGTKDGFVSKEAFDKAGFPMRDFPYKLPQFKARLGEMYPDTQTPLSPEEVTRFDTVVREQFGAEAAILHVLKGRMAQEEMKGVLDTLGPAIRDKWQQVGPSSSAEDFERADAAVMRRARAALSPALVAEMEAAMSSGSGFDDIPGEGDLQDLSWVARSLMNRGLTGTLEQSDEMRQEVNIPPPPPGISEDDPEYKKYVEEYRESHRKARAMQGQRHKIEGLID